MNRNLNPLPFPLECPEEYILLDDEPKFSSKVHLSLEQPKSIYSLKELGYSEEEIANCESSFGYCSAFRILSLSISISLAPAVEAITLFLYFLILYYK